MNQRSRDCQRHEKREFWSRVDDVGADGGVIEGRVGIIESCVWAGGMLEVLELEDMLAGVLQYCLRH